jgi:CheY-like chemotaxis protein
MKILVADKNDRFLAAVSAAFGRHCELVTATCRDACMDQVEQQQFDVVVACEKLADYTGLELLSEVASVSPGTLLVLAASPARLNQLESGLALFGLFETLSYPPDPRKLLEVLKRARLSLPTAALKIPHVVLEPEWDTGELPALRDSELQAPTNSEAVTDWPGHGKSADEEEMVWGPAVEVSSSLDEVIELTPSAVPVLRAPVGKDSAFEPPSLPGATAEPQVEQESAWADVGAANDSMFATEPAAGAGSQSPAARSSQAAKSSRTPNSSTVTQSPPAESAASAKTTEQRSTGAPAPRARTQTVPTAAQRAAFQRAQARRRAGNADAVPLMDEAEPLSAPQGGVEQLMTGDPIAPAARSESLSDLARMASSKRSLEIANLNRSGPKRAAFAVGSGLAAAIILGVLTFELRTPRTAAHAMPRGQAANTQLFAPTGTLVANSEPRPFQRQPQPSVQFGAPVSSQPQAQIFDPDTAPADPPPPPALEQPGPMEPPSSMESPPPMHGRPPLGMLPPGFTPGSDD